MKAATVELASQCCSGAAFAAAGDEDRLLPWLAHCGFGISQCTLDFLIAAKGAIDRMVLYTWNMSTVMMNVCVYLGAGAEGLVRGRNMFLTGTGGAAFGTERAAAGRVAGRL